MKTKLAVLFTTLVLTSAVYADCGYGPCTCVDPACGDPYTCMDYSTCCSAFGNIGALDSSPAVVSDNDYNPADLYSFNEYSGVNQVYVAPTKRYRHHYKGE